MAYYVVGAAMVRCCLERLGLRECHLGGYSLHQVEFTDTRSSASLTTLVFIASPDNHLYLGPASVDQLARQVTPACLLLRPTCHCARLLLAPTYNINRSLMLSINCLTSL